MLPTRRTDETGQNADEFLVKSTAYWPNKIISFPTTLTSL